MRQRPSSTSHTSTASACTAATKRPEGDGCSLCDSARSGPGAFFALKNATSRDRVQVVTADGRTRTYRVVSVRRMAKAALPNDVYSLKGRARLVLVTCGGAFDPASGHYRDNVVVTAVPV